MNKNNKPICTLYSNFSLKKDKNKVNDIIYFTKNLTLNNKDYSNYVEEYEKSTQLSSFKDPNMSSYPLFQNKNYISLQRLDNNTYQHSFRESYIKKKKNNKKFKQLFLNSEINYINEKNKLDLNSSDMLETDGTIYPNIENNKNKKEEKIDHKDLFLLCDLLFNEKYYNDCEYNEKKIFNNLKNHESFLRNKLVFMKVTNENRLNTTSTLKHTFTHKRYGRIDLILNSVSIEVKKLNEEKNKEILSTKIPFDFTPSVYLSNFEELKQIIVGLIKYNFNNNSLEFNNNYFEIYWPNIFNDNGEIIHYRDIFKSFRNYIVKNEFNTSTLEVKDSFYKYFKKYHLDNELNEYDKLDFKNIFDPKYTNVESKKYEKQIFHSSITHFEIELSVNNEQYIINITMPHIILKFMKFKKNIVEYIDKELFIYCLEQKFINWDFYMTRYLFSLKNFRKFIQILLSKNIDLSKTSVNFNNRNNKYDYFFNHLYYEIVNNYLCYTLNYNPSTINKASKNDFSYSFILTDIKTHKNNLFKIFPYIIYIYNPLIHEKNIFSFHFTLYQMKILFYVSKKERLESFILKLIQENKKTKTLDLDYSYFEIFKNFKSNEIEKYLDMIEKRNNLTDGNKMSINSYQVYVLKPHFESIQLKDEDKIKDIKEQRMMWLSSSHNLSDKLINLLINDEIEKWPEIIQQFNINLEELYNNNNNLVAGEKSYSLSNTKTFFNVPHRRTTMIRKNSYSGSANKKALNKSKTILNIKKED